MDKDEFLVSKNGQNWKFRTMLCHVKSKKQMQNVLSALQIELRKLMKSNLWTLEW